MSMKSAARVFQYVISKSAHDLDHEITGFRERTSRRHALLLCIDGIKSYDTLHHRQGHAHEEFWEKIIIIRSVTPAAASRGRTDSKFVYALIAENRLLLTFIRTQLFQRHSVWLLLRKQWRMLVCIGSTALPRCDQHSNSEPQKATTMILPFIQRVAVTISKCII